MKNIYFYLPVAIFLGSCAVMESLGLYDPATDAATPAGSGLNELFLGLTGIDVVKIWAAAKTVEIVGTKRGRDNLKSAVDPKTGLKGTLQAMSSIFLGTHTPDVRKSK